MTIAGFVRFSNTAQSDPSAAVIADPANAAPEFVEGNTAVRYVEENDDGDQPSRDRREHRRTVGC